MTKKAQRRKCRCAFFRGYKRNSRLFLRGLVKPHVHGDEPQRDCQKPETCNCQIVKCAVTEEQRHQQCGTQRKENRLHEALHGSGQTMPSGNKPDMVHKAKTPAANITQKPTRIVPCVLRRPAMRAEIQLPMTVPETIGKKSFQNSSGDKCMTSTHQSAAPAMKTPCPRKATASAVFAVIKAPCRAAEA